MIPQRFYTLGIVLAIFIASLILEFIFKAHWVTWPLIAISGFLSAVGLIDVTQTRQAIRRNYPIPRTFDFSLNTFARRCGVFHRER
jgi:hypothetical protein